MLTERLLILGLIALALGGAWGILALRNWWHRRHNASDLLPRRDGLALVLAFSTPDCVPCRTVQKPALDELQRRHPGRVEVREVDATLSPALAQRFGILTVPSTVVVDAGGHVRAINHGLAGWDKLAIQLELDGDWRQSGFRARET